MLYLLSSSRLRSRTEPRLAERRNSRRDKVVARRLILTRDDATGETRVEAVGAAEGTTGTEMFGCGGGGTRAALPMPLGSLTELLRPPALPGPRGIPLTPASWATAGTARLAANAKTKNTDFKKTGLPNMIPLQWQSA
jgi:hypothetical protein